MDPAAYAAAIGLVPEDSYGFLPIDHDDITPYLFLYRDRERYAQARAGLGSEPQHVKSYGPVRVEPTQEIEIDAGGVPEAASGDLSQVFEMAEQMAQGNLAEGFGSSTGAPATPAGSGARIVAQRLYPGLSRRSSGRQLNHFLPRYRDTVGLRSDDTYGVMPRRTRLTVETSSKEWDDYWIVYRDRPEYEQGREAWADDMHKKGKWPETMVYPGVGEAPTLTHDPGGAGGKVKIEKDGWPRRLVKRETGEELGDSLREKIDSWGYGPEDSFGVSPNYTNRSIYYAWRKT